MKKTDKRIELNWGKLLGFNQVKTNQGRGSKNSRAMVGAKVGAKLGFKPT